jgi:hypothetical protein
MMKPRRKQSMREPTSDTASIPSEHEPAEQWEDRVLAEEAIRARAYEIYDERGDRPGDDVDDWLRAEREYREQSANGKRGANRQASAEQDHDSARV